MLIKKAVCIFRFGGNFLSTAAALFVLDELESMRESGELEQNIRAFESGLESIASEFKDIIKRRVGLGLMQGLELKDESKLGEIFNAALANGLLILKSGKATLRFLPPLNISAKEMKKGFKRLKKALASV